MNKQPNSENSNILRLSNWEQDNKNVHLNFEVENLSLLSNSAIKLKVAKSSMNLTINLSENNKGELANIDRLFKIEKLYKKIIPADTTSIRKGNFLTIVLTKRDAVDWPQLERLAKVSQMSPEIKQITDESCLDRQSNFFKILLN